VKPIELQVEGGSRRGVAGGMCQGDDDPAIVRSVLDRELASVPDLGWSRAKVAQDRDLIVVEANGYAFALDADHLAEQLHLVVQRVPFRSAWLTYVAFTTRPDLMQRVQARIHERRPATIA